MVDYTSISIPKSLYEKLQLYSKKHDLTIRKSSKVLIEEAINEDLYTKKILKRLEEKVDYLKD